MPEPAYELQVVSGLGAALSSSLAGVDDQLSSCTCPNTTNCRTALQEAELPLSSLMSAVDSWLADQSFALCRDGHQVAANTSMVQYRCTKTLVE